METLIHAPCPHCSALNSAANVVCHNCGRHLCGSNPFSPDAENQFWTPTEAPQGTTDPALQRARVVRRAILSWIGQEDRLLLSVILILLVSPAGLFVMFVLPILIYVLTHLI